MTNVFDEDLELIDQLSFPVDDIFSVILGRIVTINNLSLRDHMSAAEIRGEEQRSFTREFNMTSSPLQDVKITS